MGVIECREVSKKYLRKKALNQLSFTIEENKITGLIGRNGAGKTTLLKLLSGFIKPTSGKIKIFSEQPFDNLTVSVNSILIDDQMAFPTALNLGDILVAASKFYPNWDSKLAEGLLNYFSFKTYQYHNRLSKGQKSTFNMIVGLSSHCPLTMFDEPTTGMDEAVRKDFYRALLKDYIAYPRTILISSHHLEEIEHILEDVLLIKNGECILHQSITDLKEMMIAIQGKKEEVSSLLLNHDVISEQMIGTDYMQKVIKRHEISEDSILSARRSGLEINAVSPSQACLYLTQERKGGIDDVFN
ncbi:ABC transporter ATP-binding protein [Cytobacillus horneckiae]|uniref:ATP-binding cassette domain-containing protein n=1 Tax=Cytobacillus horneckiae TaxID=549687 RepID=UPI0034CF53DE